MDSATDDSSINGNNNDNTALMQPVAVMPVFVKAIIKVSSYLIMFGQKRMRVMVLTIIRA